MDPAVSKCAIFSFVLKLLIILRNRSWCSYERHTFHISFAFSYQYKKIVHTFQELDELCILFPYVIYLAFVKDHFVWIPKFTQECENPDFWLSMVPVYVVTKVTLALSLRGQFLKILAAEVLMTQGSTIPNSRFLNSKQDPLKNLCGYFLITPRT